MGKRIIARRRGKPKSRFRSLRHKYKGAVKYKNFSDNKELHYGKIIDLWHSPAHSAPVADVKYENGERGLFFACEGLAVGDEIAVGKGAEAKEGNVLLLRDIPEGTLVHNIEGKRGDGGKFVRGSGTFGRVIAKFGDKVAVLLPSKKEKMFDGGCRAAIGVVGGGGRLEKPFVKAGKRWHAMRARGKLYPIVSAVAMNPVDHPFGSGRGRHKGKPTIAPRFAPPGRKVGMVRARRTGKKR